jgi:hypothetical protein
MRNRQGAAEDFSCPVQPTGARSRGQTRVRTEPEGSLREWSPPRDAESLGRRPRILAGVRSIYNFTEAFSEYFQSETGHEA